MEEEKNIPPDLKTELHPYNIHRDRYNFKELIASCPELAPFVKLNDYQDESIDFFNPEAVKMLNKALLVHFYDIEYWDIPDNYLCPPIPGRADYIHYLAEFLNKETITCLDVGVGANCVYPIIGSVEYNWKFVGSDIDIIAVDSANKIVAKNSNLKGNIEIRLQENSNNIFKGIIQPNERFDVTICNPPFHASLEEAQSGTVRKLENLTNKKVSNPTLNFGGQHHELWYEGGEEQFVKNMIAESKLFENSCCWFSTLISKKELLPTVYDALQVVGVKAVNTIKMSQGNKISRFVIWSFLTKEQRTNF